MNITTIFSNFNVKKIFNKVPSKSPICKTDKAPDATDHLKNKQPSITSNVLIKLKNIIDSLNSENCKVTTQQYIKVAKQIYGTKKVDQICYRYQIKGLVDNKKLVDKKFIKKIHLGLEDVTSKDLDNFIQNIKNPAKMTIRENDVLQSLSKNHLKAVDHCQKSSQLPPDLFDLLICKFKCPNENYPVELFRKTLSHTDVTGMPGKSYYKYGYISHRCGRSLEDQERFALYREIQNLDHTEEERYSEILSKILVKKHLYFEREKKDSTKMGMLIPALRAVDGSPRWYRVAEMMDTGLGKFGYRLVPATEKYGSDMPDILLFRSSATLPTAMDSFSSVISDINILPPGYLSRHKSLKKEQRWLMDSTPTIDGTNRRLHITGHSLGGSNAQVALLNLMKNDVLPQREISLSIFDSPAVIASDVKKFADWLNYKNTSYQINFKYYVSKNDPVPYGGCISGSSYVGNHLDTKKGTSVVYEMELSESGLQKEELTALGPHGRNFLRGKKNIDYLYKKTTVSEYDQKNKIKRVFVNTMRILFTPIVWSTIGLIGGLKRFFMGRRHHQPIITKIFTKALNHFSSFIKPQ